MLVRLGSVLFAIVSVFCSRLLRRYQACNKWYIFLYYHSHRLPVTDYKNSLLRALLQSLYDPQIIAYILILLLLVLMSVIFLFLGCVDNHGVYIK